MRNALPLLGAEKIQGFYRQVPKFQQVPSAIYPKPTEAMKKPVKAWEKEEAITSAKGKSLSSVM